MVTSCKSSLEEINPTSNLFKKYSKIKNKVKTGLALDSINNLSYLIQIQLLQIWLFCSFCFSECWSLGSPAVVPPISQPGRQLPLGFSSFSPFLPLFIALEICSDLQEFYQEEKFRSHKWYISIRYEWYLSCWNYVDFSYFLLQFLSVIPFQWWFL